MIFNLLFSLLAFNALPQEIPLTPRVDPLQQKVERFELQDETLGEALGRINQSFDISISIEGVLPEEGTVTNPKLTTADENITLSEVLDRICALDGRYAWSRDGNNINVFPKTSLNDKNYFFNRALRQLSLRDIRRVADAVITIDRESRDPSGGVIYMGIGPSQTFAEPWTASFTDITVRQALNQVARHLGATYGWQIGGTTKARLILFHYKLEAQQPKVGDQYTTPTH